MSTDKSTIPSLEDLIMLRLPAVLAATGLSASRIYQLERAGLFPKRISLGDNTTGWREIEVRRWLVGRIEHGATRLTGALAPQSKPAKGSRRAPAAKVGG